MLSRLSNGKGSKLLEGSMHRLDKAMEQTHRIDREPGRVQRASQRIAGGCIDRRVAAAQCGPALDSWRCIGRRDPGRPPPPSSAPAMHAVLSALKCQGWAVIKLRTPVDYAPANCIRITRNIHKFINTPASVPTEKTSKIEVVCFSLIRRTNVFFLLI